LKCLNSDVWILTKKLKIENCMWKCLESENLSTKMFELGCVNISSWKLKFENFYVKVFGIWNFEKSEMSEFGYVNIESWKLKTKIWNLFVKCLERIWNFENWNV
jgi:hypothetical protein